MTSLIQIKNNNHFLKQKKKKLQCGCRFVKEQKEEEEKKIRLFDKPLFKFDHNNSFTFMPLNNNTTTFMFTN